MKYAKQPRSGTGPTILKQTRTGWRGVAEDDHLKPALPAYDRARRWEACTCESEEKHDRGCPVHIAWVTSYAAHKGAPDVRGLPHNATDVLAAAWLWGAQYLWGVKKVPYSPGREALSVMLGAQHDLTRAAAPADCARGMCALETVSRATRQLTDARCVESGRRIMRIKRRLQPMTAELRVEPWVLALPKGATIRVALPDDFDYPDPLSPSTLESSVRNNEPDELTREIEDLFDLRANGQSHSSDLTQWNDDVCDDLVITFLAGPWMKEARDELGTGGRGLAQWFRTQCEVWSRQGRTAGHVRRSLFALLSYVGSGKVRKGWIPIICAAVAGEWSPDAKAHNDVEAFDHFQRSAIAGVRAVRYHGAEPHELTSVQFDGYKEVTRWMTDRGRLGEHEARVRREAIATRSAGVLEGSTL